MTKPRNGHARGSDDDEPEEETSTSMVAPSPEVVQHAARRHGCRDGERPVPLDRVPCPCRAVVIYACSACHRALLLAVGAERGWCEHARDLVTGGGAP